VTLLAVESTTLRWRNLPPLWVVVLVVIPAVLLAVRFVYRREAGKVSAMPRRIMGVLRVLAVLLVIGAFFGPFAETVEGRFFKKHLVVCIDTSRSMGFRDAYLDAATRERVRQAAGLPAGDSPADRPRLEIAKGIFAGDPALLGELAEKFRLHVYTFDSGLAGVVQPQDGESPGDQAQRIAREVANLEPEGAVTRIGAAIRDLVRSFDAKSEPVAGLLLFTDGRHTGGAPEPVEEARRAAEGTREAIPIFPVAIGDPGAALNVGVARVDAPEVVLADDEVVFTVSLLARGFPPGRTTYPEAFVVGPDGQPVETLPIDAQPVELPEEGKTAEVSFRYRFPAPGTYDLDIGVPTQPGEAVTQDNHQRHVVRVVQLKMRVLLVAGEPNWDFRFLKEALLREEKTISANILHLWADPDYPAVASGGAEPFRVFPQEKAALAPFDVVILMDVSRRDPGFAPGPDRDADHTLTLLEEWVAAGGGLVLEAGKDYLPNDYVGTKLANLLPVVPGNPSVAVEEDRLKRYRLTPVGRSHPIMAILQDPVRAHEFWDGDDYETRFCWFAPVERAKSGATVLAIVRPDGSSNVEPQPIVALQSYGLGKVLWLGTDELWRMRKFVENLYYWRFWSGAIRHLATYRLLGGNKRIKIFLDRNDGRYKVGDMIEVTAKFLDENFEPIAVREGDPATQRKTLHLRGPDGRVEEVALLAAPEDPPQGNYRARFAATRPGTFRLYADPERDEERAERTIVVEETTDEMRDPLMDWKTLQEVARASGGSVLTPEQFRNLLKDPERRIQPGGIVRSGDRKTSDLWDRSWVLYLFVALLATEWVLRKLHLLL